MKPIERIDNFLDKVDWTNLILERWRLSGKYLDFLKFINNPEELEEIKRLWKQRSEQRIGQFLINQGLIPDKVSIWYDETAEILHSQGFPWEECLFWGTMLDINEKPLKKPITTLVADLTPDHIRNIKNFFNKRNVSLPSRYIEAFNNVLKKATK